MSSKALTFVVARRELMRKVRSPSICRQSMFTDSALFASSCAPRSTDAPGDDCLENLAFIRRDCGSGDRRVLPAVPLSKQGRLRLAFGTSGASLAVFAWMLSLHPFAAGRVYAAYGGVYIAVALAWPWAVDGVRPTACDIGGVAVSLAGMAFIAFQPRAA